MPLLLIIAVLALPATSELTLPVQAQAAQIATSTPKTLRAYARSVAIKDKLNVEHFLGTIKCESHFNPNALGDYPDGHGHFVKQSKAPSGSLPTSFGIAQLHYPEKLWGISTSTALNPYVSIEIMANAWMHGGASKWSCWKQLYGAT